MHQGFVRYREERPWRRQPRRFVTLKSVFPVVVVVANKFRRPSLLASAGSASADIPQSCIS